MRGKEGGGEEGWGGRQGQERGWEERDGAVEVGRVGCGMEEAA